MTETIRLCPLTSTVPHRLSIYIQRRAKASDHLANGNDLFSLIFWIFQER